MAERSSFDTMLSQALMEAVWEEYCQAPEDEVLPPPSPSGICAGGQGSSPPPSPWQKSSCGPCGSGVCGPQPAFYWYAPWLWDP